MKKITYIIGVSILLTTATVFPGCNSTWEKSDKSRENVEDAEQNLEEARQDAEIQEQRVATQEEWADFKKETEVKIQENETRIAELKAKMTRPGETLDSLRQNRINALEVKNLELKTKLRDYDRSNSDWETFKREFNHDMDEIGKAFKDLTIDNKQ